MKRSCARPGREEHTELRASTSRVMQDTPGAESSNRAEVKDIKSRELNLVILGIPYDKNENTSKVVFDSVLERMQVVPEAKFRALRLGRGSPHGPAPMMVQFQDVSHSRALESRMLVMHNKYKMKGTPIKIFPDLTPKQRQALPLEKKKVQKAREQGLWCELREGVAADPVPMRNRGHTNTVKSKQPKVLPEHLREMIIAMMPFPSIFKARCLSKSWLVKFSPITSLDDETDKELAISFQLLMGESSSNWKTFWPIFRSKIHNEGYFAYDREGQKWQKFPSLSFHPNISMEWRDVEIDGALLYGCYTSETGLQLLVANLLTRSWKLLPPIPDADANTIIWKKLVSHSLSEYKMMALLGYYSKHEESQNVSVYDLRIYDSISGSWNSKKFEEDDSGFRFPISRGDPKKYLDGVLYMADSNMPPKYLLALDVQQGTLDKMPIVCEADLAFELSKTKCDIEYDYSDEDTYEFFDLVVCNGDLLMIAKGKEFYYRSNYNFSRGYYHYLHVLKIDLGSRRLSSVSCTCKSNCTPYARGAFCDGKSIYFRTRDDKWLLPYNVEEDKWCDEFPVTSSRYSNAPNEWSSFSFQPGLNPFLAV